MSTKFSQQFVATLFFFVLSFSAHATFIPVGLGDANVVGSSTPEINRDEDNLVNGSGLSTWFTGDLIVNTGWLKKSA